MTASCAASMLFLKVYGIEDRALDTLALIVRGADTARLELTPQSPGLLALSLGLSANFPDDHAMLEHGLTMYDAFYAWCRACQGETHNWTPAAKPRATRHPNRLVRIWSSAENYRSVDGGSMTVPDTGSIQTR